MPLSSRNVSIAAALLFSLALMIVAFLLSTPFAWNRADAQSSEELLKAYAKKDSDADGLYDWQESLYGTDPQNPESVKEGVKDGDAVAEGLVKPKFTSEAPKEELPTSEELDEIIGPAPAKGSLTEQFSQAFIQAYLAANGDQVLDQAAQDKLVQQLIADFTQRASKELGSSYTLANVRQSATVSATEYGHALERAVKDHSLTVETADPIPLMEDFLVENDESARAKIAVIGETYARIRSNLLALEVPPSLAERHLTLIRAYDTLTAAMDVTVHYEDDPLAVLGVLGVYPNAARGILESGAAVGAALLAESGAPKEGEPGSMLVNVMYFMQSL